MRLLKMGVCAIAALLVLTCNTNRTLAQQQIRVQAENLQGANGFWLTPVWVGLHNGNFDLFNDGATASSALELLAEEGDVSGLQAAFAGAGTQSVLFGGGFGAGTPPLIAPGTSAAADIFVADSANDRFFSYASMLIPTNDAFIGNNNPFAFEIFDAAGNFNGPVTFEIFAGNVWDSGTEVNDGAGAPFNVAGGTSSTENLFVRIHPGLGVYDGINTPAGTTIDSAGFTGGTPIARFTISAVPEPGSIVVLGLASAVGLALRRRR